jgi:hypothetical protein
MQALFNRISGLISRDEQILLRNGNGYTLLQPSPTRINGELSPLAFEYRISGQNTKRVNVNLIHAMYQRYLNN